MAEKQAFIDLKQYVSEHIVGQNILIDRLLIALLCDGHLLVEGAPGLAKTKAIKVVSNGIEGNFHRVQFTPDLLPADLTGTEIFRPQDGSFRFEKGPLFHNLILADEINRAPAKVQSALLEAMAERQITVGSVTYPLPDLFLVMATQNPIEQEGTYPLPEAQLDRFLMHVRIDYPDAAAEKKILELARIEARQQAEKSALANGNVGGVADQGNLENTPIHVTQETLFSTRQDIIDIHMADNLEAYLLELVLSTRDPSAYGDDLVKWVQYGASPRASISLDRCSRAHAWLAGRDYVDPGDIQTMAYDVLRHRIILSFEAEAEGIDTDTFIKELLTRIPVP